MICDRELTGKIYIFFFFWKKKEENSTFPYRKYKEGNARNEALLSRTEPLNLSIRSERYRILVISSWFCPLPPAPSLPIQRGLNIKLLKFTKFTKFATEFKDALRICEMRKITGGKIQERKKKKKKRTSKPFFFFNLKFSPRSVSPRRLYGCE